MISMAFKLDVHDIICEAQPKGSRVMPFFYIYQYILIFFDKAGIHLHHVRYKVKWNRNDVHKNLGHEIRFISKFIFLLQKRVF